MSSPLQSIIIISIVFIIFLFWRASVRKKKRQKRIDNFNFPDKVREQLSVKYPHLTETQQSLVIQGLRDYFHICLLAGKHSVSMPSQAVDVVWHEFILFTKMYGRFCQLTLGRFLHHTPAEAMNKPTMAQEGIKLAWKLACKHEGIDPRSPKQLPMIFALDSLLNIPDGFNYSLNCSKTDNYCASHIGCSSSGCSSCSSSSDGCSSGCGGGD